MNTTITDIRGTPVLQIGGGGGVVVFPKMDPLGDIVAGPQTPSGTPFGFAGCLKDEHTGICHFGARDYYPAIGRWLQPDPLNAADKLEMGIVDRHPYTYAMNDPINFIDPSGLLPGELYGTEAAAGYNAVHDVLWQSIAQGREYAGSVYFVSPAGAFSYTSPVPGSAGRSRGSLATGATSIYHTHGAPGNPGYELFSNEDFSEAIRLGVGNFLGTPSGQVKFFGLNPMGIEILIGPQPPLGSPR